MEKKNYIQPSIKAYKIHTTSILAGSDIVSGGSNKDKGIVTAESKSSMWDSMDDDK